MYHFLEFFLGSRNMRSSTKFTFEEVMTGKFQAESYSVKWITGNVFLKAANAYLFQSKNFFYHRVVFILIILSLFGYVRIHSSIIHSILFFSNLSVSFDFTSLQGALPYS